MIEMKKKLIGWLLLFIGIIPFAFPFLNFIYEMLNSSSWTLGDWLILYSYVYWPTYIVGIILIVIGIYKIKR